MFETIWSFISDRFVPLAATALAAFLVSKLGLLGVSADVSTSLSNALIAVATATVGHFVHAASSPAPAAPAAPASK